MRTLIQLWYLFIHDVYRTPQSTRKRIGICDLLHFLSPEQNVRQIKYFQSFIPWRCQ